MMQVEQFVMAYGVEQDRLRALLPEGFTSLRPVLRINAELRQGAQETAYLEFNTAVEHEGRRGWLNIGHWEGDTLSVSREGKTVTFALQAFDEAGPIGSGTHKRVVVNSQKFLDKAYAKL